VTASANHGQPCSAKVLPRTGVSKVVSPSCRLLHLKRTCSPATTSSASYVVHDSLALMRPIDCR
jgi:hypothetical protein